MVANSRLLPLLEKKMVRLKPEAEKQHLLAGFSGDSSFAAEARICQQCASCASCCPVLYCQGQSNIRRIVHMLQLGMTRRIVESDALWSCALCLECQESCPMGVNLYHIITSLRQIAAQKGFLPPAAVYFVRNTLRRGRPLPLSARELTSWAESLNLPRRGERIFYGGFYPIMDHAEALQRRVSRISPRRFRLLSNLLVIAQQLGLDRAALRLGQMVGQIDKPGNEHRRSLISAVKVLQRLGVEVAYLGEDEPWCGMELHTYGMKKDFAHHARKVYGRLGEMGVAEIITADTLSLTCFHKFYPEVLDCFDIKVRHFLEVVAEKLPDHQLSLGPSQVNVVFSDPCYLSRYLRVTEEPRAVLERIEGVCLREAESNRLATRCCGGGGIEVINPSLALSMAKVRAEELAETHPDRIVTSCPVCVMMLKLGLETAGKHISVVNIEDILWEALEGGSPPGMQASP